MTLNGTAWAPIGPSPINESGNPDNGMVSSIAINPNNPNVVYIGTAGGGVWRSRNGGTAWTPLFDRELALGIGEPAAIAIDPNNTDVVYAGTSQRVVLGTGNSGFFGSPDSSQGLYKSADAGNSWVRLGSGFPDGNVGSATTLIGQNINVVVVDPADSNTLYLGCSRGVFFSSDGGLNWTQGSDAAGDARSLVLDTSTPVGSRVLYTGLTGQGVFQSTDGGQNWTQILSGSTPVVASAVGAAPKGFSKVIVAIPPPASPPNVAGVQVLYVSLSGFGGAPDPVGVFQSTDQGGTWTQRTASGMPTRTQGGYSFHMAVDPASPGDGVNDIIYFGVVGQAKSTDSGSSFSGLSIPHADTHAWAFVPRPSLPSVVFCGNDGGVDRSDNGGSSWTALGGGGLQTGLVFNIDIKPDAIASEVVCALQDNGLLTTAGVASPEWSSPQGGDGFDVAYDGVTAGRVYGTSGFWPAPCTRVFFSNVDGTDFPSTVPSSQDISPYGTTSDQGCGIFPITTDPSNAGHVYVSGPQNLWQTQDGGSTWRKLAGFPGSGDVDVAAADGNNVVIAVGGQVFVTTNALATSGVTFTNITRNLPGRNVPRALFDPIDPTVIYAVLGGFNGFGTPGHVFRTTVGGTAWTDISPTVGSLAEPLDLPFNAIALDGTEVPTTIYAGTDLGVLRSVDLGASWSILDDIHFPRVPVTDLVLNQTAGVLCAGTYGRGVFKFTKPAGPSIAVELQDELSFGIVCGPTEYLTLTVDNVGGADLVISSVQRLMGSTDFSVLPTPATPLTVAAGESVTFTVVFTPSVPGVPAKAIIRIASNDPAAPFVDVAATGMQGTGTLATAIADGGSFGHTCVGSHTDEELTLDNAGECSLSISNITSSSADFLAPSVAAYPLVVAPGASTEVAIRFQPTSVGAKAGTIRIDSDDPLSPAFVVVTGDAPPPKLVLMMADKGSFGHCCARAFKDEPLTLSNSGKCTLTVSGITSSSGEFLVPEVLSYPLTIEPGNAVEVPIRFQPTSFGAHTATITVTSDDPAGPRTIQVSGDAPPGKLAITGSTYFGGVKCGRKVFRTIAVCNVGECDLHVSEVAFERRSRHWRLVHNPFPATLHPGSCLNVVLRYTARQSEPRPCELVIRSNDPEHPVREVEVIAWTRCCCWECCDACRTHRHCEEHHESCCAEHHRHCCHDERGHGERWHEEHRHGEHGHEEHRHGEHGHEERGYEQRGREHRPHEPQRRHEEDEEEDE